MLYEHVSPFQITCAAAGAAHAGSSESLLLGPTVEKVGCSNVLASAIRVYRLSCQGVPAVQFFVLGDLRGVLAPSQ